MSVPSASTNRNLYADLGIRENASQDEIKKARNRLAKVHHTDKGGTDELIKRINHAYEILSDPETRAQYDATKESDDQDGSFGEVSVNGLLHVGETLSARYKEKLERWKKEGPPASDKTPFKNINATETANLSVQFDIPAIAFQNLFNHPIPTIEKSLATVISGEILGWSFESIKITPEIKKVLSLESWNMDPIFFDPISAQEEIKFEEIKLDNIRALFKAASKAFSLPNVNTLVQSFASFFPVSSKYVLTVVQSKFMNPMRSIGEQVALCPPTMKNQLGYIPQYVVTEEAKKFEAAIPVDLATEKNCTTCRKEFGLFLWKNSCKLCGNANCTDCMELSNVPDYNKPVCVCKSCQPKISKLYSANWVNPVNEKEVKKQVTKEYLLVLDTLGFANKENFSSWVDGFIEIKKYDLAMQCYFSGGGKNWLDLAAKFCQRHVYEYAKSCLDQLKKTKEAWIAEGDRLVTTNFELALLCYQKGALTLNDYVEKAFNHANKPLSRNYLLVAAQQIEDNAKKKAFLESVAKEAFNKKHYSLAAFCYRLQNSTVKDWIQSINSTQIEFAEALIQEMKKLHKIDWKTIEFHPDRDHLRWRFLGEPNFSTWLDYLINLLQKCNGWYCIPYFRQTMAKENFVSHRDDFLKKKNYEKALVCHRLQLNSLPLRELSQKYRQSNEMASLACQLGESNSIVTSGDDLFKQKYFSLALRCYLQGQAFDTIKTKALHLEGANRLLYQLALWKYSPQGKEAILDLCQMLLETKEKKKLEVNRTAVKQVIVACLKDSSQAKTLRHYQLLAETDLSKEELQGLLSAVVPLCQDASAKKWYASVLASFLKEFEYNIRLAISQYSVKDLVALVDRINPLTLDTLNEVLKGFKIDTMPKGYNKSILLLLRSLARWLNSSSPQLLEAMNDAMQAIIDDPREEYIEFCTKILEKFVAHTKGDWKLRGKQMTQIQSSEKNEFVDRLKLNSHLNVILRYEKAIGKFKPFDAAMSYLDLCMAASDASGLANSFLSAALELVKVQSSASHLKERYAYRRAIFELVLNAYSIGHAHMCPTTRLYILRSSIAILTAAFESFKQISEEEQEVLEDLYKEVDALSKVAPALMGQMVKTFDLIYADCVNRQFMSTYLEMMRDLPANAENPIYQYYLFEGVWKGWVDDKELSFEKERERTMHALLASKGNTIDQVEQIMYWPGLTRDEEGWLPTKPTPLNFRGEERFSRVDGIRFNLETGEMEILLEKAKNPEDALFDTEDIADILKLGVPSAFFTLDQADVQLPSHPFQEMKYGPECLSKTNFLATLLHADILLKMLSMRTEVSGKAPFELRNAEDGLFKRLPSDLRKKFDSVKEKMPQTAGRVHRFWIEAGELPYSQSQSDDELTYMFGKCEMSVKKHLMRYDRDGKLIDTDKDDEMDSPEAKFAKLMTDEYDKLGKYFPELARLGELAKLQAMSLMILNLSKNIEETSKKFTVPYEKIKTQLDELKSQVTYPQETDQNVETHLNELLRKNNVSYYQVSAYELNSARANIRQQLKQADEHCIQQLTDILSKGFHVSDRRNLQSYIINWIQYGNSYLIDVLKSSLESYQREKIKTICRTFKNAGLATQFNKSSRKDACTWVPAAFSSDSESRYKVYGGVNMNPNLVKVSNLNPPSGPLGSGSSGGARYVVRLDSNGRIHGTMTGVDRVTGNTYTVLELKSSVVDQYNQSLPLRQVPNVAWSWQTRVGYSDYHHQTLHTGGSYHQHGTNGWTNCTNAQGVQQTYQSGSTKHRCNNNG